MELLDINDRLSVDKIECYKRQQKLHEAQVISDEEIDAYFQLKKGEEKNEKSTRYK